MKVDKLLHCRVLFKTFDHNPITFIRSFALAAFRATPGHGIVDLETTRRIGSLIQAYLRKMMGVRF